MKSIPVGEIRRIAKDTYDRSVSEPLDMFASYCESGLTYVKKALRRAVPEQHDRFVAGYTKDPFDIALASVIA